MRSLKQQLIQVALFVSEVLLGSRGNYLLYHAHRFALTVQGLIPTTISSAKHTEVTYI